MATWRVYKRKGLTEVRDYVPGEDLTGVRIDGNINPATDQGFIARNPQDHTKQWYVPKINIDPSWEFNIV